MPIGALFLYFGSNSLILSTISTLLFVYSLLLNSMLIEYYFENLKKLCCNSHILASTMAISKVITVPAVKMCLSIVGGIAGVDAVMDRFFGWSPLQEISKVHRGEQLPSTFRKNFREKV